jgi:protein involved in polysaccharide export with SLBB domain
MKQLLLIVIVPAILLAQLDYSRLGIDDSKRGSAMSRSSTSEMKPISDQLGASMYGDIPLESSLKSSLRKTGPGAAGIEVDRHIDENTYIIGPGDELTINLWGGINKDLVAIVNNEGGVVIPGLGILPLGNMKLAAAKEEIKTFLRDKFQKVPTTIALTNVRKFKAYILGSVAVPGAYAVNGASRITDLLNLAGGLKRDSVAGQVRLRGIVIVNDRHPDRYADLALFFHHNDINQNPYLVEGDRVFVSPVKEMVGIFGEVNFPGKYDFVDGDTFETLLQAAGGLNRGADTTNIIITRFFDDIDSLVSYHFSLAQARSFALQRDDRILFCGIPEYRVLRSVTILGQVEYPGIYPIQKDKTRLKDIIAMAGGLSRDAFLPGSTILRDQSASQPDPEFERLKISPIEALTPLERSYLKTKQTEIPGRISIDFQELYRDNDEYHNIILKNDDIISIATKDLGVYVTGAVVSPGLVSYTNGAEYANYISHAGGYNTRARKSAIMIIKGGTGVWLRPREVKKIEAGDKIWVPERQYHDVFRTTRDLLAMTAAVGTIIISFLTIQNQLNK